MRAEKEECPGYDPEAFQNLTTQQPFNHIARAAVSGVFVAVVQTGTSGVRRRVYLSLAPAQRAVQRARATGVSASLILGELHPVEVP